MKKSSNSDWNSIYTKVDQVLGEDFWEEIAEMIPRLGPRLDAYETNVAVVVVVELPGLKAASDVHVSLVGSTLHIEGVRSPNYVLDEVRLIKNERSFGEFKRNIQLPNLIYSEVNAKYMNGLLYVVLAKSVENNEKIIHIEFEEK